MSYGNRVSLSVDNPRGTVCPQHCDQLMSLLRLSEHNLSHFCLDLFEGSVADIAHLWLLGDPSLYK